MDELVENLNMVVEAVTEGGLSLGKTVRWIQYIA